MFTVQKEKVSTRSIAAVTRFLPSIVGGDFRFSDVRECAIDDMDCLLPVIPGEEVVDFIRAVNESAKSLQETLRDWGATHEAKLLLTSIDAIGSADELSLMRLLALHVRADRQVRGHLQEAIRSGHITAILSRLYALLQETRAKGRNGTQKCN